MKPQLISTSQYLKNSIYGRFESDASKGILFLLPAFVIFLTISVFPIVFAIWMSFTSRGLAGGNIAFVGLDNYVTLYYSEDFRSSLWRGAIYAFYSVFVQTFLGVLIALILNESFRFASIVRTIIIVPYLIPTVAIAFIFRWLLNEQYGLVNYIILTTEIRTDPIDFFTVDTAMHSAVWISSWKFTIFVVIIALARMQAIDQELYEMAKINGANMFQRFFDVTLPSLKNILLLVILLRSVWMFNRFDVIWLLTQGGPLDSTTTVVIDAYKTAFRTNAVGLGSAMVTIMFLLLVISAMAYVVLFDPEREAS